MTSNILDLSIIIVNWNVKKYLLECIRSILQNISNVSFEIIVVDNNSTDDSVREIKDTYPNVSIIENISNLGFAKANNIGARASKGRYILLLNPDTIVFPMTIEYLVNYLDCHQDVGAVGGKIVCPESNFIGGARHFPSLLTEFIDHLRLSSFFPHNKFFGFYNLKYWDYNDNRDVDVLSGACIMTRKQIVNEIGLFDESFFMYGEDIDLCFKIKKAGWRIVFVEKAKIIHYGEKSAEQTLNGEMEIESLWSKYYYFKKNHGGCYAFAYRLAMIFVYFNWYILWLIICYLPISYKKLEKINIKNIRKRFLSSLLLKPKLKGRV